MASDDPSPRVEASSPDPAAVARILDDLPAWFGIAEANAAYVEAARRLTTYVARDPAGDHGTRAPDTVVGVCLVEDHSQHSSEIHLLAVERAHHRRGIGRALMARVERDLADHGQEYLQVKTLGSSHPSPEYAATRRFYEALGYRALQEFRADELWPGNPCLLMVKALTPAVPVTAAR